MERSETLGKRNHLFFQALKGRCKIYGVTHRPFRANNFFNRNRTQGSASLHPGLRVLRACGTFSFVPPGLLERKVSVSPGLTSWADELSSLTGLGSGCRAGGTDLRGERDVGLEARISRQALCERSFLYKLGFEELRGSILGERKKS